ncbi:MAG: MaoC domain protein dehydratase [Marmoricola sp.]|nr:MaoC domain protein dehydratase [Marmoricola sp.]
MTEPLYAEDLVPGTTITLGTYTVTRAEIVEFATAWDPQGFHVDEDVAAAGAFGGLIASGIHSMAIFQRLAVDGAFRHWALIAGRSIQDVQMTAPVRPDDELTGRIHVDAVVPKGHGRALVTTSCVLMCGEVPVLSFRGTSYVRTRSSPREDPATG